MKPLKSIRMRIEAVEEGGETHVIDQETLSCIIAAPVKEPDATDRWSCLCMLLGSANHLANLAYQLLHELDSMGIIKPVLERFFLEKITEGLDSEQREITEVWERTKPQPPGASHEH